MQRQAPPLHERWREKPSLTLPPTPKRFLIVVFGPTHRGQLLWSSHSSEACGVVGTSSAEKKRGRDTSGSARCGVCAWWWCRPTFSKSLREVEKRRRFKRVWCTWDPAVRASGALAFAAQVFDTKELVSQDHSAPLPGYVETDVFFQMMVRVGRRMTEPVPVVMAGKRAAQTDSEGNVNRHSPQQGT